MKFSKLKKTGVVAASLLVVSTLTAQAAFAQDMTNNVVKSLSLGHFTAIQYDGSKEEEYILPGSLKEKIFDNKGNAIEKITKDTSKDGIYTKDKEKIVSWNAVDGSVTTEKQAKEEEEKAKENTLNITDSSKLSDYTCFDIKLPAYLPEGYTFEKASFYKDEKGNVKDSKYADLFFINKVTGKEIYMQERFACDETKAELGTDDKIESIKINGADAILEGENHIDWEDNNIIYFLSAKDMTRDEAIKIAESVK